ncbi:hypothetical protein N7490_011995 [Penicillium lividum]|nr:hypothetical protein N7490_011995 [Penicillium lividum]
MEQYHPRHEDWSDHSFRFISYAKTNCLLHTVYTLEQEEYAEIDDSLLRLLRGTMLDVGTADDQRLLLVAAAKGIKSILHKALEIGNLAIAKEILNLETVNSNAKNRAGQTALHLAAEFDKTGEITQIILKSNNIDPDPDDNNMVTPLRQAVRSNNLPAMKALLDSGQLNPLFKPKHRSNAPNRWTVMHAAAQYGGEEMAQLLLGYDEIDECSRLRREDTTTLRFFEGKCTIRWMHASV